MPFDGNALLTESPIVGAIIATVVPPFSDEGPRAVLSDFARYPFWLLSLLSAAALTIAGVEPAAAQSFDIAAYFADKQLGPLLLGLAGGVALGEFARIAARMISVGWRFAYVWGNRLLRYGALAGLVALAIYFI